MRFVCCLFIHRHCTVARVVGRSGGCGLHRIEDSVREALKASDLECAQLLIACGLRTDASLNSGVDRVSRLLGKLLLPEVDRMAEQIQRTLQFIRLQLPRMVPERIWIFGGGGTIPGLDRGLSERLGLRARAWCLHPTQIRTQISTPQILSGVRLVLESTCIVGGQEA